MATTLEKPKSKQTKLLTSEEFLVSIRGFWVRRNWLDPDNLPKVNVCMSEILAQPDTDKGNPDRSNH